MVVVALVLLIACANIANLLLARADRAPARAERPRRARRVAAGGSRGSCSPRACLLSGAGALLGLRVRAVGQPAARAPAVDRHEHRVPRLVARLAGARLHRAVAMATALLFGMAPALRATRVQPNDALKAQGRGVIGDGRARPRHVLVVLQVALSLVLVVAAGLFMRTFSSLADTRPRLRRRPVLVASVNAQRAQLEPARAARAVPRAARRGRAAMPGVASAALSAVTPVGGSTWNNRIELPDGPASAGDASA